ncbi:putative quinol monooxygenase [Mycobacterium lacus]|uniref:Monooxygenase n=1 Tax=Mycobacterium lacus TaxID=169765 RepID=A0A1X1YCU1_9MYCO|nr:putative quinol monooxygenase [Mycobacterium lacus]MCV7123945.1 antibiotic biosynthesis monooxygenase [Mycobacterium lacus]ORW08903.1 antibiotic biosynthesis monooxygenase [Mycobacterium lacus]BBX94829.1 monooxygenase [Mycobacterium lacus]
MSIAVIARFTPHPESRDAVRTVLHGMTAPTRAEDGCRTYDLYEADDRGEFVVFERYRDRDALDAHRASPHYVNYRARLDGLLTKPVDVTVLTAIDEG